MENVDITPIVQKMVEFHFK